MPEAVHFQESAKMFECEALLNFFHKSNETPRLIYVYVCAAYMWWICGVQTQRNFDGVGGELSALRVVLCLPKGVKTIVG